MISKFLPEYTDPIPTPFDYKDTLRVGVIRKKYQQEH